MPHETKVVRITTEAELVAMAEDDWKLKAIDEGEFFYERDLPNPFATITNKGPK